MADTTHGTPMEPITEKTPISLAVVGLLVGWIVAAFMAYSAFDARVSVIESQMQQFRSDVTEIKDDVKTLLRKP